MKRAVIVSILTICSHQNHNRRLSGSINECKLPYYAQDNNYCTMPLLELTEGSNDGF